MVERTPSGITGLDDLLEGGFLPGSAVLVSGGAGTGKTIFSTQFIYNGAMTSGEPGIYITLEEGAQNIWWNMKSFHWNIAKLQQENLVKIYRVGMFNPKDFALQFDEEIKKIREMVNEMNAKRLVIDSTTAFAMFMSNDADIRYNLFKLINETKKLGCTTLLISETRAKEGIPIWQQQSAFGVEEFVVDGVVNLYFRSPMRALLISKMRGTNQDKNAHPFKITNNGFEVNPTEQVLFEALMK
ncbi:MAG: AAA family ATPase [Candidatus Diapherotrites archaeon]|nr:AAA family ATPase [Candidatus Diapherotrites archaeon]